MTEIGAPSKPSELQLMYLPPNQWSPRYDRTFFTVKIEGKELLTRELPPAPSSVGGKANLPAYYFHLVVYREQDKTRLSRRYSQFRWLHHQVQSDPPKYTNSSPIYGEAASPLRFPQPPLIQFQNDNFAQNRMDLLAAYLSDMLSRPGYARHPAVLAFLDIK